MIKITVELQSVITGKSKVIGRMFVWNRGIKEAKASGNKSGNYNYSVAVQRRGSTEVVPFGQSPTEPTRIGEVLNYPADRYNMWRLIFRALKSAFSEES